jgi:NitT/TauT family transport system ATP-binding protein
MACILLCRGWWFVSASGTGGGKHWIAYRSVMLPPPRNSGKPTRQGSARGQAKEIGFRPKMRMNEMDMIRPVETPAAPHVTISGVSKTFRTRKGEVKALSDIDLTIRRGEFISVLGPSGCGKSTLLMLLSGLVPSSRGSIRVDEKAISGPNSDIGIVFQQDVLLEWRSALQNVLIQAEIRKSDLGPARERAQQLLKMVSLQDFENAYPNELSGGMRQRVSICRALLHRPPLLLMDEPFGALDAMTRDQLQLDLLRLCKDNDMTVFFITHSIQEAIFLSDRVVVMSPRPGRVERIIDIDLPRPRRLAMREDPKFSQYTHEITDIFKGLGVFREEV